jgi:diguanylate cyclase (GGDEF)-like protein
MLSVELSTPATALSRWLLSAYWVGGDLFGFMLYLGCRDFAAPTPLRRRDAWLFVPPVVVGLVLPGYFPNINGLFPAHALIFGGYALLAFAATLRAPTHEGQALIGLRLMQVGLLLLIALFWHYAVLMGWGLLRGMTDAQYPAYLQYSSLYDSFAELSLAFATVVLVTDSVRSELAEANRRLAEASEQLTRAARTDALTGLLNRHAFNDLCADPTGLAPAGSVAVIDMNDLKPLNDRLGHAAGDAALRTIARALQARSRLGDPVFRLGGDEFAMILPGVATDEMTRRMEEVDRALAGARLPGIALPVDVGIAWGVSAYRDRSIAEAVERADTAMYRCKQERKGGLARDHVPVLTPI